MEQRAFKIRGMDCAEEIAILKRELGPLVGGEERLLFDLLKAKMTVLSAPREIGEREVVKAVGSEGMGIATGVPLAARVLYALAILAGTWSVLPKAWNALRRFRPDMNLLMTIAVLGAVAIGEWFEGATVAFLFSLSLALESWSVGRARRAVAALMDLTPQTAHVRHPNGREEEIPAERVSRPPTWR